MQPFGVILTTVNFCTFVGIAKILKQKKATKNFL